MHHRYRPAGPVGGDYCDVRTPGERGGWLYFLVGDVVGKGVAASFVMAHLSALVRSTLDADGATPVATLVSRLNRYLAEHGFGGYEVSNFAAGLEHRSRHNRKYWDHTPYLGLGPSAHSFAGHHRW